MDWLRRNPEWVSASLSGWARLPPSRAKTLRSVFPGRYGQGPPGVRKNCGMRVLRWSVTSQKAVALGASMNPPRPEKSALFTWKDDFLLVVTPKQQRVALSL